MVSSFVSGHWTIITWLEMSVMYICGKSPWKRLDHRINYSQSIALWKCGRWWICGLCLGCCDHDFVIVIDMNIFQSFKSQTTVQPPLEFKFICFRDHVSAAFLIILIQVLIMAHQMTLFPMDSHYLDSINTLTRLSLLELQTIEKITPQQYLGEGPGVSRLAKVTSQPLLNWSKIFYCLSRGAKNAHCSICKIFWSKDQHSGYGNWVFSSFQDIFIHYILWLLE